MDIIGEINPKYYKKHKYILIATNYLTRWVEAMQLTQLSENVIMDFIEHHLITRFGVPTMIFFIMPHTFLP